MGSVLHRAHAASPVPRQPTHFAETGRGLHIVAALSDQWGYTTPTDMGKVLWALFSTELTPRPRYPHPRPRSGKMR